MFKVRNFLILAFLLAATIAFTWYSFRRNNYDANQVEDGVDVTAPFYETQASAPHGENTGHDEQPAPIENEIKGGKDSAGTLHDSSVNEGTNQHPGESGHQPEHGH